MENNNIEYKAFIDVKDQKNKTNLVFEVISFLNSYNGKIYIGIDDKGNVVGLENINIDKYLLQLKDIIKNNIMPSPLGLFDLQIIEKNNKKLL